MRRQAIVTAVKGKHIEAVALLSDVCVHCPHDCGRIGRPFPVENRLQLPIEEGSLVRVYHSPLVRGISGITALFGPIICAILSYLFSARIAAFFGVTATESFQALLVLLAILIPGAIIFVVNRSNLHVFAPIITQVL